MRPKLGWQIISVVTFLALVGCNTETAIRDEQPDPVLVEYPVVFIERDLLTDAEDDQSFAEFDPLAPALFNPGAQLFIKNNAFADSPVTNLTASLFEPEAKIDIRDLTVSDDGQQFLVSIRAPQIEGLDEEEQPRWNIWRYDLATETLSRIIVSDVTAEQGHDLMPTFLPDGRILFASTRQRLSRAILLDEGKPQYTALDERRNNETFNLHIMDADGTSIEQLSFNLSHDFYPLVLQDGRILYSRWDAMGGNNGLNLYRINPDGTDNELVFGWHSHQNEFDGQNQSIEFIKPQQLPSGEVLMLLASENESSYQKRPITLNIDEYTDAEQGINGSTSTQSAISDLNLGDNFSFNFSEQLSLSGRLSHLYPLPDSSQRYLLSWDICRVVLNEELKACGQLSEQELTDAEFTIAPPQYQLWLYNQADNTQQLVASTQAGKILSEALVMQPSEQPKNFIADKALGVELDTELAEELSAAIHIRSVYDFDGIDITVSNDNIDGIQRLSDPSLTPASALPARFLRILRGVPMPPDEVRDIANTDFGRSANQLMREIIGYTPIQPDGSVKVKVPANIPLALSVLDINGQRIGGRHRQWISLKPGETLQCNGCHTANSELPHGRQDAQMATINEGALGGSPFPNTNETIVPIQGQTMAQADEMVNGLAQLSAGISYQDRWTNPDISTQNPEISYQYANLQTLAPNGADCFDNWSAYCRIQINFPEHIQPIWELSRIALDPDTSEVIADNTCTSCHNIVDADGLAMQPAGQLDLTSRPSSDQAAHLTAYRELLFNDVEQEVVDGILIDRLIEVLDDNGNVVFEVDNDGELILDIEGNPIPVLTTVNVPAILSTNGARASTAFFEAMNNTTHDNMLTVDELKLISEWLDIGGQYYNTPFYSQD